MSTTTGAESGSNNVAKNIPTILSPGETFGVIGGGEMAKSILFPLFQMGSLDASRVIVSGRSIARLEPWAEFGCKTVIENAQVLRVANKIMWAVKPQVFKGIAEAAFNDLGEQARKGVLHVSVLAGVTLDELCRTLKKVELDRVARVMPNIGLRVRAGCAVYTLCDDCKSEEDKATVSALFSSTGLCLEVLEPQINAFTGLFGCGIAFMFPVIEAMSDGAVKMGIPRDLSLRVAAQTMKGAAELILQENRHPGVLKDSVCSAGGSTIVGIAELEKHGIRNAFISAVEASTKRNIELGQLK